ncbi:lysozyme inhibitor LprI family protein [Marinimicrobium sp. ARAG 43.8]|uniref:lysozyme inhibitor LprI family protein n=1 Tax=Marinimicrobium sp. ARAG 43.8 TaxID=3418719 RepID=UPI003CE931BC
MKLNVLTFALLCTLANTACAATPCTTSATGENPDGKSTDTTMSFQEADAELNRVYQQIRAAYADDDAFLGKLKKAQQAWITLRDADLEARFPADNKQAYYGSVYATCAANVKTTATIERIAFLQQWLDGVEEGETCAGSIRRAE